MQSGNDRIVGLSATQASASKAAYLIAFNPLLANGCCS